MPSRCHAKSVARASRIRNAVTNVLSARSARNCLKRFGVERQAQHALIACANAEPFELPYGDNVLTRARSSRSRQVRPGSHRCLPSKPTFRRQFHFSKTSRSGHRASGQGTFSIRKCCGAALECNDMAKDYSREQATEPHPEPRPQTRRPASLPEPARPLLNEGLERVRESHC